MLTNGLEIHREACARKMEDELGHLVQRQGKLHDEIGHPAAALDPSRNRNAQDPSRRRELCVVSWSRAPVPCGTGNREPVSATVGFDDSDQQAAAVGRKLGRPR